MRAQEDEPANPHSLRAMWGSGLAYSPCSSAEETRADRCASKRMNQRIRTRCERCGGADWRTRHAHQPRKRALTDARARGRTSESALPRPSRGSGLAYSPCSSTEETRADRCARKRMNRRICTRCERCGKRGNQRITRRAPLALLAMLIDRGNARRPMRVQRGRTGESALPRPSRENSARPIKAQMVFTNRARCRIIEEVKI